MAKKQRSANYPKIEDFSTSKAERAHFQAQSTRLEYEQRVGTMVDLQEVKDFSWELGRFARDGMLAISRRVTPQVVGVLGDPHLTGTEKQTQVEAIIQAEVARVMDEIYAKAVDRFGPE